jgi:lipoprotein-anchoring transpeptidase ErfK/SrfK
MRRFFAVAFAAIFVTGLAGMARAEVNVEVDVGSQTMNVYVDGDWWSSWPVSTGRRGHETPRGSYRAKRLERTWYSSQYDDAPMPYSILFRGGYAIHGTSHTKWLGQRASHGCVRLAPGHAAKLFSLVSRHGMSRTRISIYD